MTESTISVSQFPSIAERVDSLGLKPPDGISVLPRNFASASDVEELVHEADASTICKVLEESGIDATLLSHRGRKLPSRVERDFSWVAPTIFVSSHIIAENPELVRILVQALAEYIVAHVSYKLQDNTVSVSFVIGGNNEPYRKIKYEGPANKLGSVVDELLRVADE